MKKYLRIFMILLVSSIICGALTASGTTMTAKQSQAKKAALLKIRQGILKTVITEENAMELMKKIWVQSGFTKGEASCYKRYIFSEEMRSGLDTGEKPGYIGKTVEQAIEEGKKIKLKNKEKID